MNPVNGCPACTTISTVYDRERHVVPCREEVEMVAQRRSGLSIEPVLDEVVVFNPATNSATALNSSAALIFGLCDGEHTVEDMHDALVAAGLDDTGDDAVWLALDELAEAGLVDLLVPPAKHLSRREILMKYSLGAAALVALPVVESITAPSVAAAASNPSPTTTPTPSPVFIPLT